jgi:hypothetical protein
MADLLIRDLTPEVIHALDVKAKILGISRVELVRRTISREVTPSPGSLTEEHLAEMVKRLPDLGNPEIMRGAWS